MIDINRLKRIIKYDPETGLFSNLVDRGKSKEGTVLGRVDSRGYVRIKIDNVDYTAGRLAWFYMTGKWPTKDIDHDDTNKENNKWKNLREATDKENTRNRNVKISSRSGAKGVKINRIGKFEASIKINGQYKYLGLYDKLEEAAKAYEDAAKEAYGEFARYTRIAGHG